MKPTLSPKELAEAIGVSESSIKRWADGGRLAVQRTAGGHRRIPREEALRFLRDEGLRPVRPEILGVEEVVEATAAIPGEPAEELYRALLSGREEQAQGILTGLYLDGRYLAQILDQVLAPAMTRIGDLWQHDEAGIYIEHRAVDICERALDRIRDLVPPLPADAPTAIGGAPAGDPYSLPSRMAATVLREQGWQVVNLGAFTPANVAARAAADHGARLVWLALSLHVPDNRLRKEIDAWRQSLAEAGSLAGLVVGGPAFREQLPKPARGAQHAGSMAELAAYARGLYTHHAPGPNPAATGGETR